VTPERAAWDLLVRGATLIDPAQSISARRDVAFSGGRVAGAGHEVKTARRLRTRHVIRAGRRLPAAHADQL
jgi:predicted amidohydrolase